MERLDVVVAPERANIEAAIHFARYAIGTGLVKGRRVLDIACGEGYGSYLLKTAGADYVAGVDISNESVERARQSFGADGLEYFTSDAKDLRNHFSENSFDLVISVETIEHVENPVGFLEDLRRLVKPDGVIIISCPNDHWYYPDEAQSNPYHRRKYRLNEFQDLCISVLGEDVRWSVGTCVFGFASTPLDPVTSYSKVPKTWMNFQEISGAYLVAGGREQGMDAAQSSYFVGVWNAPRHVAGGAVFPLSMDAYEGMVQAQYGIKPFEAIQISLEAAVSTARAEAAAAQANAAAASLEADAVRAEVIAAQAEATAARVDAVAARAEAAAAHADGETVRQALVTIGLEAGVASDAQASTLSLVQELENVLKATKRERRRLGLMFHATQVEGEAVQHALRVKNEMVEHLQRTQREAELHHEATQRALEEECNRYRIGYERYIRLRKVLPAGLRSWIVRTVKAMRGQGER